ncbi:MAG: serine hydrolase [Candidatus Hodarchaeales archaeon]|jgi:CubicO group peptidase (beta-lactamase class C family)
MDPINIKSFKKIFEREVVDVMRDFKVPGMSVLIKKDNKVIYDRGFGYRDLAKRKPATSDTIYGIASITKSMTSLAILQLSKEGKLDIHKPITDYLPIELEGKDKPITLHHLMCHASGMPCLDTYAFIMVNQGYNANIPTLPLGTWDDFYSLVNGAQSELVSPPGSKYYYWNGGFTLLGQIIEKVTGMSYEEYMQQKIFNKLGMNRSTFFREDLEHNHDVSSGYSYNLDGKNIKRTSVPHLSSPFVSSAGGLNTSAIELSNYLQAHINNGEYEGNQIFDEQLLKEMYKPHNQYSTVKNTELYGYGPELESYYGYGLRIYRNYYGYTLITHHGYSGFSGGIIAIIPELKLSYVQLYNVAWIPQHPAHAAFVALIGKNPEEVIPYYKRRSHYTQLCGNYQSYKEIAKINIEKRGGMLYLTDENWVDKVVLPLIPKDLSNPKIVDFYSILPTGTIDIHFEKQNNGSFICEYERRIFRKNE